MNTKKTLLLVFLLILVVNILLTLPINGPTVFPDETCALMRAKHFSETLSIDKCSNLAKFNGGDPMPLYSILISPLYLFVDGIKAFKGALIFNAIITSSLIFALFGIFKKFIKKDFTALLLSIFILFTPAIIAYEFTMMTENIFAVITIWFLYFYMESFEKNKKRNKILATIFAILGVISRPFGFILLLSMIGNEIMIRKKRKKMIGVLAVAIFSIAFLLTITNPGYFDSIILRKFRSLSDPENLWTIVIAIKNQMASYIVATFFVPIAILFTQYRKREDKILKKIKWFLIFFIGLILAISAQHIYGYYLHGSELHLQTRYINTAVIFTLIFAFAFLATKEKINLKKNDIILTVLLFLPILFFQFIATKHSQNLDLVGFFNIGLGHINATFFLTGLFIPIITILFAILLFNNKKLLIYSLVTLLIISSSLMYKKYNRFSYEEYQPYPMDMVNRYTGEKGTMESDTMWKMFENTKAKVLMIPNQPFIPLTFWKIKALTNNDVTITKYNLGWGPVYKNLDYLEENYDYLITSMRFPFELEEVGHTRYGEIIYKF